MTQQHYDTVVIGGGLAGLTAATLLAQGGQRVALYEQARRWGGRALTNVRSGFQMNLGPHALYRGGSAEKILTQLGIFPRGKAPAINRHAQAAYGHNLYQLPATPATMATSKLLTMREKMAYGRALIAITRSQASDFETVSWGEWCQKTIPNAKARATIAALARLSSYANAPDLIQASVILRQLQAALGAGVLYLDGGWQQLVDALAETATVAGVTLRVGERVNKVTLVSDSDSWEVQTKGAGQAVYGQSIVFAVPPKAAIKLLPQSKALAESVAAQVPVKAACLTLGMRTLPKPKTTFALGIDQPLYFSNHSATATLAPVGNAVVHLAKALAPESTSDSERDRNELWQWMEAVQPAWRHHVVESAYLPTMTVYHALPQVGVARPAVTVADVANTYVIGDWVDVDEILADASFASAQQATASILKLGARMAV